MVQGLTTLGGALAYPNWLVVAIVVSHKHYTALVEDKDQQCNEHSDKIKEEFHAPDGQVFIALQSVQIAHAFIDYINKVPSTFVVMIKQLRAAMDTLLPH